MPEKIVNSFKTLKDLTINKKEYTYFSLVELHRQGLIKLDKLPFSIRILVENLLRNEDGKLVTRDDIKNILSYDPKKVTGKEIPFMPARVILQDFTGVPAVVDLAAMRDAVQKFGGNPERINPIVPSDLVIDHSVQVDYFGTPNAFQLNVEKEYERNKERYTLIKWAQQSFKNFSAVPPGTGIVHQVNLEYLGQVVMSASKENQLMAYPDTLVGTDSHTTMINGLSVLGWGVGGIEAEAVMLGQPYYMVLPEVVGVKLTGALPEGSTATDLVLTITEMLRKQGVVGKFVEYFGPGLSKLTLPDRATIANMSPEYGATMGFFPIDDATLDYLKLTGRNRHQIELVERYAREQRLFRTDQTPDPDFSVKLELDMNTIKPSLAGPKRPQDRVPLKQMKPVFLQALQKVFNKNPEGLKPSQSEQNFVPPEKNLQHGSVVIAAITSCTNTSNPTVMVAAGLLAKKALERGLKTKPWVKTSLAPGSRVVSDYLQKSGLLKYLDEQRFNIVGYGCTTCIGNSGPLPPAIEKTIRDNDLVVASVLSGNRNFEGRIHPYTRANYLASPPLVVAYALAGQIDFDLEKEPLGKDQQGNPVFLKDIWPTQAEIKETINNSLDTSMFKKKYSEVYDGDENWRSLKVTGEELYHWDPESTYIKNPPFFENMPPDIPKLENISNARILALLGDTVTTDHISPAGAIPEKSPAGQYLISQGVEVKDFNSFGSRRGNHEIMIRGTFGNIRIKNKLLKGIEGGYTVHFPTGKNMFIYDASVKYQKDNTPLIVIAGKEYGTGSSRDWAAKGTALLGIKAVISESYERIHRSNLIGMGVLPLQFKPGENFDNFNLKGDEFLSITGIENDFTPGKELEVTAADKNNNSTKFTVISRLDTEIEVNYYRNGGILQTVLRQMMMEV